MSDDRVHVYDYQSAREGETFHDIMMEQLKRSPYFLISLAIHLVLVGLMYVTDFTTIKKDQVKEIQASVTDESREIQEEEIEVPGNKERDKCHNKA